MTFPAWPTIQSLREVFGEEVHALGGLVTDVYEDADAGQLFARATLPIIREVRPGDGLKGGIAMRATEDDVRVHPYTFRLVCRNGAIRAHATQTVRVRRDDPDLILDCDVLGGVRDAIRACSAAEAFDEGLNEMRGTLEQDADIMLWIIPLLKMMPAGTRHQFLSTFLKKHASSRFHAMQTLTSTARDTNDPEVRWRLEELGGGVPLMPSPAPRPMPRVLSASKLVRRRHERDEISTSKRA